MRDTRLDTAFEGDFTVHHHDDSDDENNTRSMRRSEYWQRMHRLGHGAYGDVWLQKCVQGKRNYELRAVKIIPLLNLKNMKKSYVTELEAIAKFSQKRVSSVALSVWNEVANGRATSTRNASSNSSGGGTTPIPASASLWNTSRSATCRII